MKNYYTTEKYIKKFIKRQYRKNDIALENLNYRFILDFEKFLINYKPVDHHKPLHNNGIMKHMERLRKMVSMAFIMDFLERDEVGKQISLIIFVFRIVNPKKKLFYKDIFNNKISFSGQIVPLDNNFV